MQFTSAAFIKYCEELGIRLCFASIAHPHSNRQVERANTLVLKGLKTRTFDKLKKSGRHCVDELSLTQGRVTGDPFRPRLQGGSGPSIEDMTSLKNSNAWPRSAPPYISKASDLIINTTSAPGRSMLEISSFVGPKLVKGRTISRPCGKVLSW